MKVKKVVQFDFELDGNFNLNGFVDGLWNLTDTENQLTLAISNKTAKDLYKALHEVFGKKEKQIVYSSETVNALNTLNTTETPKVTPKIEREKPPEVPPEFLAIPPDVAKFMN